MFGEHTAQDTRRSAEEGALAPEDTPWEEPPSAALRPECERRIFISVDLPLEGWGGGVRESVVDGFKGGCQCQGERVGGV